MLRFHIKNRSFFEICAREICEKFIYKHSATIEYVINEPTFKEIYKLHRKITREVLGLRMQNFKGIFYMNTNI